MLLFDTNPLLSEAHTDPLTLAALRFGDAFFVMNAGFAGCCVWVLLRTFVLSSVQVVLSERMAGQCKDGVQKAPGHMKVEA